MDRAVSLSKKHQIALTVLLGIAVFAPVLLRPSSMFPWVPVWSGAVTAFLALVGSFLVFWQTGALRTRFLVLFLVGVVAAAACAALLGHT